MPVKPKKKTTAKPSKKTGSLFADRYELLRKAGKGGGGTVYLAKDQQSQREVALKVLDLKKSKDPSLAQSLENEFAALTLLKHQNLAKVHDYGKTDKEIYLSSEWIAGEDIVSASRKADLNSVFRYVVELLRAVDYLHRRGVLHLDLKPENILIARAPGGESHLRLIDFGLAQWQRHGVRGPGEFSGTPPYAAPELLQELPASPASDTYSIGMLLHQIFSEGFPFPSQDLLKILQAQLSGPPSRALNLHAALPDSFGDLLFKSVSQNPGERFASPSELLAAINDSLEESFSLRDSQAPAGILEESDHFFRPKIGEELLESLRSDPTFRVALLVEGGLGKNRLMTRLKEKLQIEGVHPLYFSDLASFKRFLERREDSAPLLLDLETIEEDAAREISRVASLRPGPLLLALRPSSQIPEGFSIRSLLPLKEDEISEFLQREIREFPLEARGKDLFDECRGRPDLLETTLQSLREEGFLQWSDQGWCWFGTPSDFPKNLIARHEARWKARLGQAKEWLGVSPLGLNAELLAGLLGVDAATLDPWLSRWVDSGHLQPRLDFETVVYSSDPGETQQGAEKVRDWEQWRVELQSHYDTGEFALGIRMLDLLSTESREAAELPDFIQVHGARLLAAAGKNEQALNFLPKTPPLDPPLAGLFWEVSARIHVTSGNLSAAESALEKAEPAYAAASDLSGASRVYNLRGWTLKKQGHQDASLEAFEMAITAAVETKDDYARGLAEMNRGTVFHDQGRLEMAQECYEEAFRSAERAKHPLLQLKLMQNQVNLLFTMGRNAEGEPACYRLLRLAIQQHNTEAQAGALNFLSLFYGQRGDIEHQTLYLNQAIESLGSGSPQLPQLYFNRAHLNWDQKKMTAAQIHTEAALAAAKRFANPFVSAWSQLLLGKILRDRPKPDFAEALQHLETARTEMSRQRLGHLIWEAEFDLGLLAKITDHPEKARVHFETAKDELKKLLPELPENLRQSYLRDRKLEKIEEELKSLS